MRGCADVETWQRFLLGQTTNEEAALLEGHLEQCAHCLATLQTLDAEDSMVAAVRSQHGKVESPQTALIQSLAESLKKLPRASDTQTFPSLPGGPPEVPWSGGSPDGYEILVELGRGGMGVVYKAQQTRLGRLVALKMILSGSHASATDRERFRAEAQAIARLQHPHIVQIYEVGEHGGLPYFSLEFCGGGNLANKMAGTPLLPREAAALVEKLAHALQAAHARGVLHRDLKPANVLLAEDGTPKITDFGLAKKLNESGRTQTGAVIGTPSYMAPEQVEGKSKQLGPACDIYALGALLYDCLTGRPPFRAATSLDTLMQVVHDEPVSPARLNAKVPRDLATICLKCLRKEPAQRYATALELANDLRRFQQGEPIKARRTGELERLRLWCRRKPAVATLTATVLVLVVAVAVGSTLAAVWLGAALDQSERDRTRAERAELGGKHKLWQAYLAEAQTRRMFRQPGQRFTGLRALPKALDLPVPPGRSSDELRNEAIACLCLPDLEPAQAWDGWPLGSESFAIDGAFARYARADKRGNVRVRRVSNDELLFPLPGVGLIWPYRGLEFSPDGQFLHHVCQAGKKVHACLWKLQDPPVAVVNDEHFGFAFRPDSRQLAASYTDGSVRLYDTGSGHEVRRFDADMPAIEFLRWNPKLPQLVLCSRNCWRLLDVDTGELHPVVSAPGGINWVDWHPEGRLLAVSSSKQDKQDWKIHLWDAPNWRPVLPPLEGHKNGGVIVCFNHAGDRLLSTDWSHLWRLWDVRTGQQLLTQPAVGKFVGFSPDDQFVGASFSSPRVQLFRFRSGQEFRTLVHYERSGRGPYAQWGKPVLDPEGRLLAIGTRDGVALVDVARGEEVTLLKIRDNAALGFEPAGALLTCGPAGILRWPLANDPANGRRRYGPPERLAASGLLHFHGMSTDGQVVASPNDHGADVLLRQERRIIPLGPQGDVRLAAVSPDGKWVATGSHGPQDGPGIKIWEMPSGKHAKDLPAGVFGLPCFSPDGKWLLTSGDGAAPQLWAVGTWQEGPDLGGIPLNPWGAFSPDSKLLALGDAPGIVRLVRVDTGKEIARLTAPEPVGLLPCCFTPDGGQLITAGSETQALHIFDLRSIRAQLAELDLDWEAPPLPAAAPAPREPLRIEIAGDKFAK